MFCDKCGAMLKEEMEYCDKCGAKIEAQPPMESEANEVLTVTESDEWTAEVEASESEKYEKPGDNNQDFEVKETKNTFLDNLKSLIPTRMFSKEDKTFRLVGVGCLAVIAVLYLINFFVFLDDICYPIGMGTEALGADMGASPVWMILYWLITLVPVVVSVLAIRTKEYPLWMICTGIFYILLTVVTFGVWVSFVPNTLLMALTHYDGMNMFAWYVLVDCLSEMWYLKLLFFVLGFSALYMEKHKVD